MTLTQVASYSRDIIGLLSLQKRIAIASSRWNGAGSNVSIAAIPPSELAVWFSTPGW